MAPAKRKKREEAPALEEEPEEAKAKADAGPRSSKKPGFKDVKLLASAFAPYIKKRFSINYTCDRSIKYTDQKKLLTTSFLCL